MNNKKINKRKVLVIACAVMLAVAVYAKEHGNYLPPKEMTERLDKYITLEKRTFIPPHSSTCMKRMAFKKQEFDAEMERIFPNYAVYVDHKVEPGEELNYEMIRGDSTGFMVRMLVFERIPKK